MAVLFSPRGFVRCGVIRERQADYCNMMMITSFFCSCRDLHVSEDSGILKSFWCNQTRSEPL